MLVVLANMFGKTTTVRHRSRCQVLSELELCRRSKPACSHFRAHDRKGLWSPGKQQPPARISAMCSAASPHGRP